MGISEICYLLGLSASSTSVLGSLSCFSGDYFLSAYFSCTFLGCFKSDFSS